MKNLVEPILYTNFAAHFCNGTLADRLGNGLQNRVEQFDSARYLTTSQSTQHGAGCDVFYIPKTRPSVNVRKQSPGEESNCLLMSTANKN